MSLHPSKLRDAFSSVREQLDGLLLAFETIWTEWCCRAATKILNADINGFFRYSHRCSSDIAGPQNSQGQQLVAPH
jgi:hypothetical protein